MGWDAHPLHSPVKNYTCITNVEKCCISQISVHSFCVMFDSSSAPFSLLWLREIRVQEHCTTCLGPHLGTGGTEDTQNKPLLKCTLADWETCAVAALTFYTTIQEQRKTTPEDARRQDQVMMSALLM